MTYTGYELFWLFFLYSFLGWVLEVVHSVLGKRKFINRGFLNGIVCPVYGFSMVFLLIFMESLKEHTFYLFLGCMIVGSVIELLTGLMLEKCFQVRLWDYSKMRFQVGGYICLAYSAVWGVLGTLMIKIINPLLMLVVDQVPWMIGIAALAAMSVLLAADTVTTVAALLKIRNQSQKMLDIAEGFTQASNSLRTAITVRVEHRIEKAFPNQEKSDHESEEYKREAELKQTVFAYGCGFYKVVWLFLLGSFLGDLAETLFCYVTTGRIMSRSSVVYGPFSLVWGIGVAGASILLYKYRDREDRYLFGAGVLLGGAYEYICSVFTELVFGTVFWDYSGLPFNLGGRINLLFCFFWGIAALVWMKLLYPFLSKWIEKIPKKLGKVLTHVLVWMMIGNVLMSALALSRYSERQHQTAPVNGMEEWLDTQFPDSRMERIYPNAIMTE